MWPHWCLLVHHPAAPAARAGSHRRLHLHLDLERFSGTAHLSDCYRQLHRADRPECVPGLHRNLQLGRNVRYVRFVSSAAVHHFPDRTETPGPGHRHNWPQVGSAKMSTPALVSARLSRRDFVKWGATASVALAAAACVPAFGGGGGNAPKNLNVAQWGTAQRADLYKQALALFQQNNPGVTTNLQFA